MVADGTLIRLNPDKHPNCYYARSDKNDVARVVHRTFVCPSRQEDAGPLNNWMPPDQMREKLDKILSGCMRGRTMYVVPYLMGPPGSPMSKVGVELTDSPYVVANMRIMTRMGQVALDHLGEDGEFSKGIHSMVRLDPEERYISHFPEENLVISVNSNYGGNALLGKKCFALRLASVLARKEGWLAEHMLIIGITDPSGRKTYIAGAFPSACGKTNLAMLVPPEEDQKAGWKVETIGDDIAWMRFGPDGRLYAVNPEAGFFGVAPGTSMKTNPNAILTLRANSLFTNVALLPDKTVWWEGLSDPPPLAYDWQGNEWRPGCGRKAAHPNARFTAPAAQCPSISPDWEKPDGVPISAIIFGTRRTLTYPLIFQSFDWAHGTYIGATMRSEKTAAAEGKIGELNFDPMAMKPFCGYHMADYWQHWLEMGQKGGDKMPLIFHVNWFRKREPGEDQPFLWPGFGQNIQVLKWIVARCHGEADAVETPLGWMPTAENLNLQRLGLSKEDADVLLGIDRAAWQEEVSAQGEFLQQFGDRLPESIRQQHEALQKRLQG